MKTINESIAIVTNEAFSVAEKEYHLYEMEKNGTWNFIRDLTYDEMNELVNKWSDFDGYIDNDFGVIDQTILFTHVLLDRVFIAERF